MGKYGATRAESMVAPPYARLYARREEALYFTVRKSTQLGPLEAVYPGYVGFPSGFVGVGWVPVTLNDVEVYESPLPLHQLIINMNWVPAYKMNACLTPLQPGHAEVALQTASWIGAA